MTEQIQDLIIHLNTFVEDVSEYLDAQECLSDENRAYFNGVLFAYQDIQDMLVTLVADEMVDIAQQHTRPERDK